MIMDNSIKLPRIVIAGTHSGAGKTSLTLGVIRALKDRKLRVQPFKVGPDYIDTGWHSVAAGLPSHNLDSWMGNAGLLMDLFSRHASQADISVVEGVMGLFDGAGPEGIRASTAEAALLLEAPVVLVVNGHGLGYSILAMIKGYRDFMPSVRLAGVIINQGGDYHRRIMAPLIEKELGVAVLGCLPHCDGIELPERHLGLLPAGEKLANEEVISTMAGMVNEYVDLERLESLAASAPQWQRPLPEVNQPAPDFVIAVARDEAFSFYYEDNLDYLRESGAELRFFSPLRSRELPEAHGLILGGGFPEIFLPELQANQLVNQALKDAIQGGMPVWAECGGYMYLCEGIEDFQGHCWPGLGVVPGRTAMGHKLARMGYRNACAVQDSPLALIGEAITGHEFHYSTMSQEGAISPAFSFTGVSGGDRWMEGFATPAICASYLHIHLRSNPRAASRFVESCRYYRDRNGAQDGMPG